MLLKFILKFLSDSDKTESAAGQRFAVGPGAATPRNLKSIYRISDGSYKKERFDFATKEVCLRNFLKVFQPRTEDMLIIADNVGEATWNMVNDLHGNVVRT